MKPLALITRFGPNGIEVHIDQEEHRGEAGMNSTEPVKHLLKVFDAETGGDDWLGPPRLKSEEAIREYGRQQFEAGLKEAARATCPTCAAGDVPRPHSKLGGWFHIGPEGEDKQRVGCHAAAIYNLVPPAAQPAEAPKPPEMITITDGVKPDVSPQGRVQPAEEGKR